VDGRDKPAMTIRVAFPDVIPALVVLLGELPTRHDDLQLCNA